MHHSLQSSSRCVRTGPRNTQKPGPLACTPVAGSRPRRSVQDENARIGEPVRATLASHELMDRCCMHAAARRDARPLGSMSKGEASTILDKE